MMNEPAKPRQADTKKLPEDVYFRLLLRQAEQSGLLSAAALSGIQAQLASLLAGQARQYTGYENSSLRVETAERLLQSVCYTLGMALKGLPDAASGIAALSEKPLAALFQTGQTYLARRVSAAWRLYQKVLQTRVSTCLSAYNDTLDGIRAFFPSYNHELFAQDAGGSIDYPLLLACPETGGVTFLYEYLRRLLLENRFCACFQPKAIALVLRAHSSGYRELLLNISQQVLQNALGCVLAGRDVHTLRLADKDRESIAARLRPLSAPQIAQLLQRAAQAVCGTLPHAGEALTLYICEAASALVPSVRHALETDTLAQLFVTPVTAAAETVRFTSAAAMDDGAFRRLTDELQGCRHTRDKLLLIQTRVRSMSDLLDLLESGCLFGNEFAALFSSLQDTELAILAGRLPRDTNDTLHHTAEEDVWHAAFRQFLSGLETGRAGRIRSLAHRLDLQ